VSARGQAAVREQGWPPWVWILAFVLFLGAAGVVRDVVLFQGKSPTAVRRLATYTFSLLGPAVWAGILLLVLRIARRTPLDGTGGVVRAGALAAGITGAHSLASGVAAHLVPPTGTAGVDAFSRAVIIFPTSLVVTLGLLAAGYAVAQTGRRREHEARGARLQADLARARMQGLQSQLRPHFLFNVLQSVATLMHRDVQGARAMLARLRVLLERSLAAEQGGQAPLREELALLRLYTDIEAVRFGERLRVEVELEGDAEDAPVPVLLLQPLVENAIRHAVEVRGEGTIRIRARRDGPGQPLHLRICDPGAPAAESLPSASSGIGIGLSNTRSRLELLYGDAYALWIDALPGEGTVVHVRIPAPAS
jgi:two-component system LytT family sensor kinase